MTQLKLVSVKQLAEDFGVCEASIRRWVRAGVLPHIRLRNKLIRFRSKDIETFLAARRAQTGHDFVEPRYQVSFPWNRW
jgi:excisionase family DNA binding protein